MSASANSTTLHPVPASGMVGKIVRLVSSATIVSMLCVGAASTWAVVHSIDRRIQHTYPAVLQWSGETVLSYLEDSRLAIARAARHSSLTRGIGAARASARSADFELLETLNGLLMRSQIFASLVALDAKGEVLGSAGPSAELDSLLQALSPKNALDSDLGDFMQATEVRKQLAGIARPEVSMWRAGELPPVPLASAQVRDSRGRAIGSLHGIVRRDGLAEKLHAGVLGGGNLILVGDDRRIVASAQPLEGAPLRKLPEEMVAAADAGPRIRRLVGSVTAARAVGALGLSVIIRQPIASAYAPALIAAGAFAAVGLLMVIVFPLIATRSAYKLIRPLRLLYTALRGAARDRLPAENLSLRKTVGETESLFQAFNVMADRIRSRVSEVETSRRALREQNQAFQGHHEKLQKLSVTDELTKLNNHRYFQDHLGREIKRLTRTGEGLVLLLIDIDHFKKVNDTYGHAAGDEFLRQIARILKEMVRETDLLARYGGEEFAIICTATTLEGAVVLAEKLRTAIAESSFIVDETMRPRGVTVSIGVARYRGNRTDLFNSADAALYRAKDQGRNCVVVADEGPEPPPKD